MKTRLILFCLLATTSVVFAQKKFAPDQQKVIDALELKRKDFKAATNDSLFVSQNSDQAYHVNVVTRGDQAEDIEEQIFKAKPGEVVGPFDGDNTFYLLKLISIDSLKRTKVKTISFFPKGEYTSDTAKFSKLVDNYIATIKKGKEYGKMLLKDEASIGVRNKGITSYWEGHTKKENYDIMIDRKVSEPYVRRVGNEIVITYVLEEKKNTPFRARVSSLVKTVK